MVHHARCAQDVAGSQKRCLFGTWVSDADHQSGTLKEYCELQGIVIPLNARRKMQRLCFNITKTTLHISLFGIFEGRFKLVPGRHMITPMLSVKYQGVAFYECPEVSTERVVVEVDLPGIGQRCMLRHSFEAGPDGTVKGVTELEGRRLEYSLMRLSDRRPSRSTMRSSRRLAMSNYAARSGYEEARKLCKPRIDGQGPLALAIGIGSCSLPAPPPAVGGLCGFAFYNALGGRAVDMDRLPSLPEEPNRMAALEVFAKFGCFGHHRLLRPS